MTRFLYSFVMWLLQPFLRCKLLHRGRQESGYRLAINERFGRYLTCVPTHAGLTLWIHAVSLGETRAAAVLIDILRKQLPNMRLLLTHGTATGRAEGARLLQPGDLQAWQPWDSLGAVQRFLDHFNPDFGVLMETEIWPNLVHEAQARGIPVMLANARLSDKSLRRAQRLAWLARPAYVALTAVWAQTPADAQRLSILGAQVRGVLGNLKFDAAPDADQLARGRIWRTQQSSPVVMFASSRAGEELALLEILEHAARTMAQSARIQWLIVPRHPQRFAEVARLIEAHGFSVQRRTDWTAVGPANPIAAQPCIWLGDSLGEMALYYALADAALLGGSFAPLGGQNLIEAAACGCPVVMGPHTFNFTEVAEQSLAAGAALRAADMAQAVASVGTLLGDESRIANARQMATQFAMAHQGGAGRLADALITVMKPS